MHPAAWRWAPAVTETRTAGKSAYEVQYYEIHPECFLEATGTRSYGCDPDGPNQYWLRAGSKVGLFPLMKYMQGGTAQGLPLTKCPMRERGREGEGKRERTNMNLGNLSFLLNFKSFKMSSHSLVPAHETSPKEQFLADSQLPPPSREPLGHWHKSPPPRGLILLSQQVGSERSPALSPLGEDLQSTRDCPRSERGHGLVSEQEEKRVPEPQAVSSSSLSSSLS